MRGVNGGAARSDLRKIIVFRSPPPTRAAPPPTRPRSGSAARRRARRRRTRSTAREPAQPASRRRRTHSRLTGVKLTCAAQRLPGGSAAAALTAPAALAASTQNGSPSSAKPRSIRPSPTRHTTSALRGSAPAQRAARHDWGSASATSVLTLSRRSAASSWKAVSRRSDSPLTPHKIRSRRSSSSSSSSSIERSQSMPPLGVRASKILAASKPSAQFRPGCAFSGAVTRSRRRFPVNCASALSVPALSGKSCMLARPRSAVQRNRRGPSQRRRAQLKSTRVSSGPSGRRLAAR